MKAAVTVKENYEFRRIYRKGKSLVSPQMVLYWQKNRQGQSRLGITVSTKLGHAVVRNRVRRRFRDLNLAQIGRPYPGMMDLYIDETNLYHRMWLYTKQFDWEKMWAIADGVTDEAAIRQKAQDILDTFDIEGGGTVEKV